MPGLRKTRTVLVATAILPLQPFWLGSASAFHPQLRPLENVIIEELKAARTPGGAIAAFISDRVVYSGGFGIGSVQNNEPVPCGDAVPAWLHDEDVHRRRRWRVSLIVARSISMPGRVRPASRLNASIGRVTGDQLLSHMSGLFDEAPMMGSHDETALEREVRSWTETRFFTEPGRVYSYLEPGLLVRRLPDRARQRSQVCRSIGREYLQAARHEVHDAAAARRDDLSSGAGA